MKKMLATIGGIIKKGIETAIGACINQLIKFEGRLKRARNDILNKLLVKISSLIPEGYSQQLIEIEKGIKKLKDALPSEEEIEKSANLAKTARAIPKRDLRAISEIINKISKEDIEKITALAEATKGFKRENARAISKFIKKFSKEELEKIEKILIKIKSSEMKDKLAKLEDSGIFKMSADKIEDLKAGIEVAELLPVLDELELTTPDKQLPPLGLDEIKKGINSCRAGIIHKLDNRTKGLEELTSHEPKITAKILLKIVDEYKIRELQIRELHHKGVELLEKESYKEAHDCFASIIQINSRLKKAWLNKGIALGLGGSLEDEINCYIKALEIDENYREAWYNRGIALKNLNRPDEAEECFKEVPEYWR